MSYQRQSYKNFNEGKKDKTAAITEERIAQLNSIGFEWSPRDKDAWPKKFALLCVFHRENGHCRVPANFVVDSVQLGGWVLSQRQFYRNFVEGTKGDSCITEERIAQLNSIGFEWSVMDRDIWEHKFELLCTFQREKGHCNVPYGPGVDSVPLYQWTTDQRRFYRNRSEGKSGAGASITEERIAKLNAIGFEWVSKKAAADSCAWRHKFELLCAFQRENGHCRVPKTLIVDSVKLGQWVSSQRQFWNKYREGKCGATSAAIAEQRIAQLNSIDFQ